MVLKKPRSRGVRFLFALLLTLATVISVSVATQDPALADTGCSPTPVQQTHGAESDWTYTYQTLDTCTGLHLEKSHTCMVMGTASNGVQAIQCADVYLDLAPDSATPMFEVYGVGSYYCQGSSGIVACNGVKINESLGYKFPAGTGSGIQQGIRPYTCGSAGGEACPVGKVSWSSFHYVQNWNQGNPPVCWEVWGVNGPANEIWITNGSGKTPETDSGTYSGAHVNICFNPVTGGFG